MRTYYDALFGDIEGTKLYNSFLRKHLIGKSVLEFACGTGDLMNLLSLDYDIKGIDIDSSMISKAVEKYPNLKDKIVLGNFLDYEDLNVYDSLVCVGDSLNYLQDLDELSAFVDTASKLSNHIIVDFHHPYRLVEFQDDYYEEGSTEGFDYSYLIEVYEDSLIHTINFLDGTYDTVLQWVFEPGLLIELFSKKGYSVELFTDFDTEGISSEGEKVMAIFHKESL